MSNYTVGPTQAIQIDALTLFGNVPRAIPSPGSERVATLDGKRPFRGYPISTWRFGWVALTDYILALNVLCSAAGTGTVDISGTALAGTGTQFTAELAIGHQLAIYTATNTYKAAAIRTITDADTATLDASIGTYTGKTFRYRAPATLSGECYVKTRDDNDFYSIWRAIVNFPAPSDLERSGEKCLDVAIAFDLVERKT